MKNKSAKHNGSFAKALVFGVLATIAAWLVLTLLFSLLLLNLDDHTSYGGVISIAVSSLSLAVGGYVCAKLNKQSSFLGAVLLSTAVLALSYGVSALFCLSRDMSAVMKTVWIAFAYVSSLLGARLGVEKKSKRRKRRG